MIAEVIQFDAGGAGAMPVAGWVAAGLIAAPLVTALVLVVTGRWWR